MSENRPHLGLVGPGLGKDSIDLGEHVGGLSFHASGFVVRDDTGHADKAVMDGGAAVPVTGFDMFECHGNLLQGYC